jgi:alpha-glucoside transport system permease protein
LAEAVELNAPVEDGRRWAALLRDLLIAVAVFALLWFGLRLLRDPETFAGMGDLAGKLTQAMLALAIGIAGVWAVFIVVNTLVEHLPIRAAEVIRPWVFVLPALAIVSIYLVYPAVRTIFQSFTEVPEGEGALSNYTTAFTTPEVQIALRNNVIWLLVAPLAAVVIGLAFAALADRVRNESLAKTFIFLPLAISMVGASVIWGYMYAWRVPGTPQVGLINAIIQGFGGEPVAFMQVPTLNTFAMIVIMIWLQVGFAMVILSSAIKAVPVDEIEASRIDGANEWQVFRRIVIPSIASTLVVVWTTVLITTWKVFDIVYVMTGGRFETSVVAERMVTEFFTFGNDGMGAALAVLLFVAVLPILVINVRRFQEQEATR